MENGHFLDPDARGKLLDEEHEVCSITTATPCTGGMAVSTLQYYTPVNGLFLDPVLRCKIFAPKGSLHSMYPVKLQRIAAVDTVFLCTPLPSLEE